MISVKATSEYWSGLSFDYIITYSLHRGPKWDQLLAVLAKEKQVNRRLLVSADSVQLAALRSRLKEIERQNGVGPRLTDENNSYNITASPVATLRRDSEAVTELERIFLTPYRERDSWMCAPVFRDALAFYSAQDELVGVLNICFQCSIM
ncbi:hypothetical protein [Hymenobacter tenuis]